MEAKPTQVIKIFYSYASEDKPLRDELEKQLKPLKRQGQISEWHDQAIQAGTPWGQEIDAHLSTSDIILLLISPDFFASEYCWSNEMQHALERHRKGVARIIPIILRPVDWRLTPLGALQALPRGGNPITRWPDRDEALEAVASGIRDVVTTLLIQRGDPRTIYMQVTSTRPTFSDRLDHQSPLRWSNDGKIALFEQGAYHLYIREQNVYRCGWAQEIDLGNVAFQAEMTILEGDGGGMVFRAGQNEPSGYRFSVSRYGSHCIYGKTVLTQLSAPKADLNHIYLLTVIARNSSLLLYVNKKCIASIVDDSATSGRIGFMAVNHATQDQAHVIFRNAQVWNLANNDPWEIPLPFGSDLFGLP
ncbi:MAG: toll/interleukin-1 receptor domain-containing protein [Ktedonobacteraceae bacterium]|nr:toll/interleukin-1 receptor domain-containing protein [Ktedonobacteraceae bacterium]